MDKLMLLSTYLPWVRHQIGRLFAGPLSSATARDRVFEGRAPASGVGG